MIKTWFWNVWKYVLCCIMWCQRNYLKFFYIITFVLVYLYCLKFLNFSLLIIRFFIFLICYFLLIDKNGDYKKIFKLEILLLLRLNFMNNYFIKIFLYFINFIIKTYNLTFFLNLRIIFLIFLYIIYSF